MLSADSSKPYLESTHQNRICLLQILLSREAGRRLSLQIIQLFCDRRRDLVKLCCADILRNRPAPPPKNPLLQKISFFFLLSSSVHTTNSKTTTAVGVLWVSHFLPVRRWNKFLMLATPTAHRLSLALTPMTANILIPPESDRPDNQV